MSKRRPPFVSISAVWTWEAALEYAHKGRLEMLAMMVSKESIPEQHWAAVAELLVRPPIPPKAPKRAFLDHEAEGIRAQHEGLTEPPGDAKALAPKVARSRLAKDFGVNDETIRDIVEKKKSYAPRGEQNKKAPQRKRVHHKK
jgi:hypothetical protein